jgi:hypothetical protein
MANEHVIWYLYLRMLFQSVVEMDHLRVSDETQAAGRFLQRCSYLSTLYI